MANPYRLQAFERESEILFVLLGKSRCLQLVRKHQRYGLTLGSGENSFELPCLYFVTEWIEGEIDAYFEVQESFEPLKKIELFRMIFLGIRALHINHVFHRDVKADNLRIRHIKNGRKEVVAIDLGASARLLDEKLLNEYNTPVGAKTYASPENIVGFAGSERDNKNDIYSLGCLLYELFNSGYYYYAIREKNKKYEPVLGAIAIELWNCKDDREKVKIWDRAYRKYRHLLTPPPIDGVGSTAPKAIAKELNELLRMLVSFNFLEREDRFDLIDKKIISMIKIMKNNKMIRHRLETKRKWREAREKKLRKKIECRGNKTNGLLEESH